MKLSLPLGVVPFALASLASAQQYEIVDLGIAGVADSEAFALNERSDVVGIHDTAFTGEKHAFLWTKLPQYGLPAGATDLGTLGGTFADAQGINALGQTTGGAFTSSSPFSQRAYLWLPAPAYGLPAGMNALGTLGGTQVASRGEGLNALGQIAGTSFGGNPGDQTAFLYLPTAAYGLGAGLHSLGALAGGSSFGVDVNVHGEVVGRSDAGGGATHAILWLPSAKHGLPAGKSTLPLLAPHPDVSALDVNAHGLIVGYASTATGVQIAALFEHGAWNDLNVRVAAGSGWTLDVANAINDAGDIAGRGTFNGASRAFLLRRTSTPPLATYCTAKTTSNGCVPRIDGHGSPSVANGASFQVTCIGLRNQKSALLLYGSNGRASLPFSGGTLCVAAPQKRTPLASTGGSAVPASDCSGVFQLDFNAFAAGLAGGNPSPALSVPGTTIDVQTWGRDPGFSPPNNTQLSDALEYVVAP